VPTGTRFTNSEDLENIKLEVNEVTNTQQAFIFSSKMNAVKGVWGFHAQRKKDFHNWQPLNF